jgi:hypothetical protein
MVIIYHLTVRIVCTKKDITSEEDLLIVPRDFFSINGEIKPQFQTVSIKQSFESVESLTIWFGHAVQRAVFLIYYNWCARKLNIREQYWFFELVWSHPYSQCDEKDCCGLGLGNWHHCCHVMYDKRLLFLLRKWCIIAYKFFWIKKKNTIKINRQINSLEIFNLFLSIKFIFTTNSEFHFLLSKRMKIQWKD